MRRKLTLGAAIIGVFTLGVVAASLATAPRASKHLTAHTSRAGSAMHATASATGTTKVTTIETSTRTVQPGEVNGAFGTCPKKAPHAINGYWGTDEPNRDGDLVNVRSTPVDTGGRRWEVAVKNVSATAITIYLGTVCIK
jgi:hypothetical protein